MTGIDKRFIAQIIDLNLDYQLNMESYINMIDHKIFIIVRINSTDEYIKNIIS